MRMPRPKPKSKPKGFKEEPKPYRHSNHIGSVREPGSKRAVNVSIDAEILAAAKTLGINLSMTLEDELRKRTREAREAEWRERNAGAFEAHNRFIEEHGIWSRKYRSW